MSYAEIGRAINSRPSMPLSHYIWLDAYKTYGEGSYVYRDKGIWGDLMQGRVAANDSATYRQALAFALDNGVALGKFLGRISGITPALCNGVAAAGDIVPGTGLADEVARNELAFLSYVHSGGEALTPHGSILREAGSRSGECYLVKAVTRGRSYSYSSTHGWTYSGCKSGAQYTGMDSTAVTLGAALNTSNSGYVYTQEEWGVGKLVKGFASVDARTTDSHPSYGTRILTYSSVFYYVSIE